MSSIKPATFQVRFDPDVLKRTDWKAALEGCKSTDELHAEKHLQGLQKRATADGDVQVAAFWEALSAILSLSLNLTDRATPLHAQYTTPEWQTASLENFPPETLRSFGDLLIGNIPPVIAARLADAIWSRLRVHQHGRRAVKEYIALAENGLASGRSVWAIPRIIRAARISAELDPNGSLYDETMARVENWLAESVEQTDEHHVALSLLDLVHDQRWGNDYLKWADISKRLAMAESKCSRYDFARQFWEMEVRFCERVEDQTERVRSGRIAIAESYEKQAEIGTHGQKAHWLTKAIEAWRRVGGSREKVDILLSSLKQEQKLALGEMGEIQTPFDATEILESGRTCVRGKSGLDAILALGIALSPPHRSELEVSVKEDLYTAPL